MTDKIDYEDKILGMMKRSDFGILPTRKLYVEFGESAAAPIREAIESLEKKGKISVKGESLEGFKVFQSVLVLKFTNL